MNDNKISARIYRLPVDSSKLDTAVDNCSNDVVLIPLRANEKDNKLCSGCVARYMTLDGKYFDMSLSVAQWEAYYDCAIPEISKITGDIMNYDEKLRHRIDFILDAMNANKKEWESIRRSYRNDCISRETAKYRFFVLFTKINKCLVETKEPELWGFFNTEVFYKHWDSRDFLLKSDDIAWLELFVTLMVIYRRKK